MNKKGVSLIKKIYLFFVIISMFFVACTSNTKTVENPTKNIISKDTIVLMLIDIHIADSYLSVNPTAGKNKIKSSDFYYSIFDKYGYTKEQFKNSIDFYSQKPKEFEKMYEDVLNTLKAENVAL